MLSVLLLADEKAKHNTNTADLYQIFKRLNIQTLSVSKRYFFCNYRIKTKKTYHVI